MSHARSTGAAAQEATVITASRRNATLITDNHQSFRARMGSQLPEVVVGDRVVCIQEGERWIVSSIQPRERVLSRSFREKTKVIAVNLDHLLLITAVGPLFNTTFIDRVIAAARLQRIPLTLVINKSDLGRESVAQQAELYAALGQRVEFTCAKSSEGLGELRAIVNEPSLRLIAFAGISGVGKSSLLNSLVPDAQQRTGEISQRTGQGRQTTSLAVAYVYPRDDCADALLIDLPGIQNFGVSSLAAEDVRAAFVDIAAIGAECEFSNCSHIGEHVCAVKEAVESGRLAESRYASYCGMIDEIEQAKRF